MKKAGFVFGVFFLLVGTIYYSGGRSLVAAPETAVEATPLDPISPGLGIITSRTARDGRLATANQAILGPDSCTQLGDPYSPLTSIYAPGPYTYTYRIRIPANYSHDVIRVELFDPDSTNTITNTFTILRTNNAITNGYSPTDNKTCGTDGGSSSRIQPCLLITDEENLVGTNNIDLDQINPYWFVRIDENRRPPETPGGTCGAPASDTPAFNTQTVFSLAYFAQNPDQTIVKVPLAAYIGQTGDGVRDNGDHHTDLRWVSPGASVPFSTIDTPGNNVPAISGTIDSFEVNLTSDVPGIVSDTRTGDRYLYLDVRTISGASENGYEIWAGPPTYVDTVPSEVNARNLFLLNNPRSHDAEGVEITAVSTLVQNSNYTDPIGIPMTYIGPEIAGQTINIQMFDSDAGSAPPIVFYFDSIAFTPDSSTPLGYDPTLTDWATAFAVTGQPDPDGVAEGVRCVPGNCNNLWVDPAYQITIPGDLTSCDWDDPTPEACTPFYGGHLMAWYDGGFADTYAWQISQAEESEPLDPTLGCSAFPITIHEGTRSLTAPGTGSNPFPDTADFTYPTTPPSYASFLDHNDDVPLLNASAGDLFRVYSGFGNGNFGWLLWNIGMSGNANTLANSLTWPGDSTDYTPCSGPGCPAGAGVPGSGFPTNVPGYIEPLDPTDQALHIDDWVAANTGAVVSTAVFDQLNSHIDLERTLRLPIWDTIQNPGANGQYKNSGFAIFRLVGYNLSQNWLLLEFVNFDTSCGQLGAAPTAVSLTAPTAGEPNTSYTFTADISPSFTSTPITYTWQISGQNTITNTGGISNTVSLSWDSVGGKSVMVTAVNQTGLSVSQTHTIHIAPPQQKIYLPVVIKN
ncbi:MAG: hypothetical protein KC445_03765 [Anaerolineales bacterium]|nr:hypothetical protein [Anaerolineales bacterium]